jgi:hypothetical protein
VRLAMTVGALTELSSWVLGWGKTAKVVEPEELVASVRRELEEAVARYRSDGVVSAPPDTGGAQERRPAESGRAERRRRGRG